jgi:hypothetical protein
LEKDSTLKEAVSLRPSHVPGEFENAENSATVGATVTPPKKPEFLYKKYDKNLGIAEESQLPAG